MGATSLIADFIVNTSANQFDEEVIEKGKEALLDWIGVTLAGLGEETSKIILDYVKMEDSSKQASIIGTDIRTSAANAALAMGTISHAVDFDDVLWPMRGHPSVTLFPAILSLGEFMGTGSIECLEAFVTGFEVEAVIGAATADPHYKKGWHTTNTIGTLGAAAASARILRLSHEKTRNALGIAASTLCGLRSNFGTMTKPLHAGIAARNGVFSALLANSNFTANPDILETNMGFAEVFCGNSHSINEINKPGNQWSLVSPGRVNKMHASCNATHSPVDCILDLGKENNISFSEIEEIECFVNPEVPTILIYDVPQKGLEGKFCLKYCLAVAAIDGVAGLDQFSDERVKRDDVINLMNKITIYPNYITPESRRSAKVIVKTRDRIYQKSVLFSRGSFGNPVEYKDIYNKFSMCSAQVFDEKRIKQIAAAVDNLPVLKNIEGLIRLCCPVD